MAKRRASGTGPDDSAAGAAVVSGIRISHPDRLIYPDLGLSKCQLARYKRLGLAAWVKTTGGRGLHVVVPVRPSLDWSDCLAYSKSVAEALVRSHPALYTITFAKRGRERKILIDYLRNNRMNTSVCAYSPRARSGATVSLPIAWKELSTAPDRWTLLTVPRRLHRVRTDPWAGYWTASQGISKASIEVLRRL